MAPSRLPRGPVPRGIRLEHEGFVAELVQPGWVPWLVLWPVPLGFMGLGVVGVGLPAGFGWTVLYGLGWVVGLATSVGAVAVVRWWTAPVTLVLRADHLVVRRRFGGRIHTTAFDLRHTRVVEAPDRGSLRFVREDGEGPHHEHIVSVPFALRGSPWLGRALRGAVLAARQGADPERAPEDHEALTRLLDRAP